MFSCNEQTEISLAFKLTYKSLKQDALTTQRILLGRWLPLTPTYTYIDNGDEGNWVTFSFRFLFNIQEFNNKTSALLDVLVTNLVFIKNQGQDCYLWDFEIYITYHLTQSVLIKPEQLKLITLTQSYFDDDPSVSISLNSSSISPDKDDCVSELKIVDENDTGEYYQLIFYTQCDKTKQTIISNWNDTYNSKYALFQHWGYDEDTRFTSSSYIVLSINTGATNELFEWNEIENDLFNFIKQNKELIGNHTSKLLFGVYNCCYDGGEVGSSVISPLIEFGIDLLITRSLRTPFI
jgi:hypothetical protein